MPDTSPRTHLKSNSENLVAAKTPSFQLMLHCLEHLDPTDWSDYVRTHAPDAKIRDETLELIASHHQDDDWLPSADDQSRLNIKANLQGTTVATAAEPGDRYPQQDIELGDLIGRGTANLIFEARQIRVPTNSFVVKTPSNCKSPEREFERYAAEFAAHRRAVHPNVANVFSYGSLTEDKPFLAMERLQGQQLGQYLLRADEPLQNIIDSLVIIYRTVADLHDRGIAHGDLNPDNIMMVDDGERIMPKIFDFGKAALSLSITKISTENPAFAACVDGTVGTDTNFQTAQSRDIRAMSYMLYSCLRIHRNFDRLADEFGEDVREAFGQLIDRIQWDGPPNERSSARQIALDLEKLHQMMLDRQNLNG